MQQYGIVTLYGGSAGFTGTNCMKWAGHIGNDTVMIQGNILVSSAVIDDAMDAYEKALVENLPLEERLIKAMVAGSDAGGDSRGGEAAAMTAFLAIAKPDDPPGRAARAIIITPPKRGMNPVAILAETYNRNRDRLPSARFPIVSNAAAAYCRRYPGLKKKHTQC